MPTVLRIGSLRVTIYPNDHPPAHVHVIGGGREAVFDLKCPDGPPELRQNFRFARRNTDGIAIELDRHLGELCDQWERIHG